ncbi:MAG: aminotransferase class IV family protein [Pseudoxanthomonas sp.]
MALLNGLPASAEDLQALALVNYGHFTSIQVRDHAVQGLELHQKRLLAGTRELFGTELDFRAVRAQMRAAVAERPDCTLRVTVYSRQFDYRAPAQACEPDVLVTLGAASPPRTLPLRVKSFDFLRPLPHIKHVGTFPLFHYRRQAIAAGFDDALFADDQGLISEGSIWNLGFWQHGSVVWPQAPALRGTAERLLQSALERQGVAQVIRAVSLAEMPEFEAAFACNAGGIQPIAAIDETAFAAAHPGMAALRAAAALTPWEPL